MFMKDTSLSGLATGFIIALVGMTSSAVLVFQAAQAAGANPSEASSWLGSLCIGMGVLTILLSLYYKAPVLIAWSTPGAALLVTGLKDIPLSQAIGAFCFSALLIFLSGATGFFEKIMNKIPLALASALLAGVLFHFSLDSFLAIKTQPTLIGAMFVCYLFAKKIAPQMCMLLVLIMGCLIATANGLLHFSEIQILPTMFHFASPTFSATTIISVGIPLFVVTMASQNLTGITAMRANGYQTPISPLITWTGLANLIAAPFGGFAINLAAITAAIAMGPEAHPDPKKRYFAGVVSGFIYLAIGIMAATVTSIFAAFPKEMVMAIAGLALLSTIGNALQNALSIENYKDSAFITFAVAASGLTIFGIGSAFWALLAGAFTQAVLRKKLPPKTH